MKNIFASAYAGMFSVALTVAVTLGGELNPSFKDWLKSFTGHHWVTKSWLVLISLAIGFVVVRALIKNPSSVATRRAVNAFATTVCAGIVIFFGFYSFEYFK